MKKRRLGPWLYLGVLATVLLCPSLSAASVKGTVTDGIYYPETPGMPTANVDTMPPFVRQQAQEFLDSIGQQQPMAAVMFAWGTMKLKDATVSGKTISWFLYANQFGRLYGVFETSAVHQAFNKAQDEGLGGNSFRMWLTDSRGLVTVPFNYNWIGQVCQETKPMQMSCRGLSRVTTEFVRTLEAVPVVTAVTVNGVFRR